jgi:brefeldin A-inhibited guanine nucleotide-exchange protein
MKGLLYNCLLEIINQFSDSERDLKSHAMRSKLLSLHLVLTVLNSHMPLFVDPAAIIYSNSSNEATSFVQAINQYLCLTLSRNAVSPVPQVFEISVEIFWRVLSGMRTKLKVCVGIAFRSNNSLASRKRSRYCCMKYSFLSSK